LRRNRENRLLLVSNLRENDIEATVSCPDLSDHCEVVFSRDAEYQISEDQLKVKLSAYGFSVMKQ
jgi:hypothetical protein